MTDQQDLDAWVSRLRQDIPNVVAVILKGSHARGTADAHSDIDFDVLVDREPYEDYLALFEEVAPGQFWHVSIAVKDLTGWMANAREPVSWGYGLPAAETTRLLWARDEMLRTQLDRPARMHPPEEPELEDFIEAWGKVRNALQTYDGLGARLAAQKIGRLCPGLLRPINPETRPSNRREAMQAVLTLPVAPGGYREDLLCCLGLGSEATSAGDIHNAAQRLVFGTIALLREHAETMQPLLPADLHGYLIDGTLDRYVRQDARSEPDA